MGSIFAPADVETLIASFPPLSVSGSGRPPVVRTLSKNSLQNSSEVLASFTHLVDRHDQRISKSNLASILDIEQGSEGFLLDQPGSQLYYSSNNTHIIPHPLLERIADELKGRATRQAVDLYAFAQEQDIGFQSLDRLVEEHTGSDWPRAIIHVDATVFLCTHAYSEELKARISEVVSCTGNEICDLSKAVEETVPSQLVVALATEVIAIKGGTVSISEDHVKYTPPGFDDAAAQQAEKLRSQRVTDFEAQLRTQGYCVVRNTQLGSNAGSGEETALTDLILEKFAKAQPHSMRVTSLVIDDNDEKTRNKISSQPSSTLLVRLETLREELEVMKLAVKKRAVTLFRDDPSAATPFNIVRDAQSSDFGKPHNEDLARLLLQTEHVKELEASASNCLSELESARHERFVDLIETRIFGPLQCYAAGIIEIQDATLKQHLEDFLTVHFKTDAVPNMVSATKEQGFLHDRQRKKESDKLQKAIEEARTWDEIQKSIAKFAKKLCISPPSEELVLRTKSRALDLTVKSMQRMTRGSDVLQNLIWVLLAVRGPGLFMSPGKDTSRMIKHCDTVLNLEAASMLAIWRDKLKNGMQDDEDLTQMKDMARSAVAKWNDG